MEGAMEGAVTALTCTASRAPWTKVEGFKVQVCITLGQKNVTLTSVPTSVDLKHEYTYREDYIFGIFLFRGGTLSKSSLQNLNFRSLYLAAAVF